MIKTFKTRARALSIASTFRRRWSINPSPDQHAQNSREIRIPIPCPPAGTGTSGTSEFLETYFSVGYLFFCVPYKFVRSSADRTGAGAGAGRLELRTTWSHKILFLLV